MSPIEPHGGEVKVRRLFGEVYEWLVASSPVRLQTSTGSRFFAEATVAQRGRHFGEKVIRFKQQATEYARAYECCWGRYYNCSRTRIGMYCAALDAVVRCSRDTR